MNITYFIIYNILIFFFMGLLQHYIFSYKMYIFRLIAELDIAVLDITHEINNIKRKQNNLTILKENK